jgi:hypothetical protein
MVVCMSFSVTRYVPKIGTHVGPDKVGVDEKQSRYEGLDLEDICKDAKNPYCKEIIDDYCNKSCQSKLCAKHGSIRGMCRLMCEAEDLPPECLKMGSTKLPQTHQRGQNWPQGYSENYPQWNQQWGAPQE